MNTDTLETDHIEKNLGNAAHPILSSFCRRLERERDEAREQRDRLAEALRMITTFDYTDLQCDNGHGARSVATEALQSLTPNKS